MLIPTTHFPLIAKNDIFTFKVMLYWNGAYYICPPAFESFRMNNVILKQFYLNNIYCTDSNDVKKDYRVNGVIGNGFFHTFDNLESAKLFIDSINNRLKNPNKTKHPELYKIPYKSGLVILNAKIPKSALYYEGEYTSGGHSSHTYASNKIIYTGIHNLN